MAAALGQNGPVDLLTLTDGGQRAEEIAERVAAFVDAARSSLALAKVAVADDVAFLGSFNLSRSGERNAENVLEIRDAAVAERLAGFVDQVGERYPPTSVPEHAAAASAPGSSSSEKISRS